VARLRVLVIGAGRRVQNNFLPALHCLRHQFEVVGVHARTSLKLLPVARAWNVSAVSKLNTVDWSAIDVVAISVPVPQNLVVLNQLLPHADRLRLVIDTPIATTLPDLAACERLLPNFRQVLVTEDYMNFPQFRLVREAAENGLVGSLYSATLLNIGYFFHGLALIRSLAGFPHVWRSRVERVGRFATQITYHLRGGFKASVVGPYRPDRNGGLLLEGTSGIISDCASDGRWGNAEGRTHYTVRRNLEDGHLIGFKIESDTEEMIRNLDLPELREMRAMSFEDKSELNLCRGCGLIEVFRALVEPHNFNHAYSFRDGLYDSFVSRLADRGLLPVDPLVLAGSNVMSLLRAVGSVQGARRRIYAPAGRG
jgi:hypothetical protein